MGEVAVLRSAADLLVIVTSRRLFPVSLNQYSCLSIDPTRAKAIIVKGVHAPAAAYESIASRLIHVNTPGPTTAGRQPRLLSFMAPPQAASDSTQYPSFAPRRSAVISDHYLPPRDNILPRQLSHHYCTWRWKK